LIYHLSCIYLSRELLKIHTLKIDFPFFRKFSIFHK
jgi:hypothetical protein